MVVLVIGSGGREHALADACARSPSVDAVHAAPGNPGMAACATCHDAGVEDLPDLVKLAKKLKAGLVVIGPEVPLALGLADRLRAEGFPVFGPDQAAARLESSKAFAKDFMVRHGIPTAASKTFTDVEAAEAYLEAQKMPVVIKASGLAAGKGVIITDDLAEAKATVADMLSGKSFGESGEEVVIEDFLSGPEVSVIALVSKQSYALLPPSQDHKRIGEGDTGPNTGGMGAYAPTKAFTSDVEKFVRENVMEATLQGLDKDGLDFRGCLFVGMMLTEDGPKVLEYNVRFGDPETQALLRLVDEDLAKLFLTCARGGDLPRTIRTTGESAIVVVLAAEGYPGKYEKGAPITIPDDLPRGVRVFHAGTHRDKEGKLVTAGGRVLGVTATGPDLDAAAELAYRAIDDIHFPGKQLRRDIGWRERG